MPVPMNIAEAPLPGGIFNNLDIPLTDETLSLVRRARQADIMRGINLSTGFIGYDLHTPAQVVQPVMTPVVNTLPRVMGPGIDVHHFKSITSFGWQGNGSIIPGVVDENATPTEPTYTLANLYNVYQTIGQGNSVSFKAQWRGRALEGDVLARRTAELIYILKLIEEQWLIYYSDYLWAPPAPLAPTTATTGGTIAANTYFVGVSAYSANGETPITLASSTITTTGATSTITLTFFTQPLATGYRVYVGTSSANGSMWRQVAGNFLGGVAPTQTIPNLAGNMTVTLTSLTTSGTNPVVTNAAMVSQGANTLPLTFNSIMALIFGAGNQAYANINGAPSSTFTAAGNNFSGVNALGYQTMQSLISQPAASSGKIAYSDLRLMLLNMFKNARANPDFMAVSPDDNNNITDLLSNASGTRVVINAEIPNALGVLTLGTRVTKMLNPTTGKILDVEVWPFLPQGTIIFGSRTLPFPVSGFDGPVISVRTNQEYYGIDYPPTKANPQYSFADYVDETLVISYLGGWSAITGIVASA